MNRLNMFYALDSDNHTISINDAVKDKNHSYICPGCSQSVIARQGSKRIWHFAHKSKKDCTYGLETSLHLMAKSVCEKAKYIWVPPTYCALGMLNDWTQVKIDKVVCEKRYSDIIPDVLIYSGNNILNVEIAVTHKIDEIKFNKLKALNISTIEIDLSKLDRMITFSELEDIICGRSDSKHWIYNKVVEIYNNEIYTSALPLNYNNKGFTPCVLGKRCNKYFSPIANVTDCCECIFHNILRDNNNEMREVCLAQNRISCIEDIDIPIHLRFEKYKNLENRYAYYFIKHICPECEKPLIEKINTKNNSKFYGCNYPECEFSTDDEKIIDHFYNCNKKML